MIRENFVNLSPAKRDAFARALNKLWQSGEFQARATMHGQNFHNGIHMGPAFLPWHRDFLRKLEIALQAHEPNVMLPYWDWTRPDSRNLDDGTWKTFFGGRPNSGGKFDHWTYERRETPSPAVQLPSPAAVIGELEATGFHGFRRMEVGTHVPGHNWVGGTMASGRSPLDLLFFLHHGNIDRLWSIWQLNHPGEVQYEHTGSIGSWEMQAARVPLNSPMVGGTTPAAVLNHAALGYTYERDLALEAAWLAKNGTNLVTVGEPVIA